MSAMKSVHGQTIAAPRLTVTGVALVALAVAVPLGSFIGLLFYALGWR